MILVPWSRMMISKFNLYLRLSVRASELEDLCEGSVGVNSEGSEEVRDRGGSKRLRCNET